MSTRPWFLRFQDEAEARSLAFTWMRLDDDGNPLPDVATETWSYHVCGDLWRPAVMDGDTIVTPAQQKPGFHVNVLSANFPDALLPYVVDVETPDCVFGGYPAVRPEGGWEYWDHPMEAEGA